MKKIFQELAVALELLSVFAIFLAFIGSFLDFIKYSGFFERHSHVSISVLFASIFFLNYILIAIDKPTAYWWNRQDLKILNLQSKVLLPLAYLIYLIFWTLEGFHYPNYVYSTYHVNFAAMPNIIGIEVFLLLLPYIAKISKKYISMLSKELKKSELFIAMWLLVMVIICIVVNFKQ
jgi:hypothetical protein